MKLIVGLGNPGKQYDGTRHNIGFRFIDHYCDGHGLLINKKRDNGLYTKAKINDQDIIFLKPQSYMNLSGQVVADYMHFFKIPIEDLLIIHDDLDLYLGNYKLKQKGSSGGHNGLKDIENHLKSDKYKRLKIGISNNKTIDTKDYVLGKFTRSECEQLDILAATVDHIIDDFLVMRFDDLMSKYNSKNEQ